MVTIVKIGGNVIDNAGFLNEFLSAFANIQDQKILVHGGGKIASDIGLELGIEPHYVNGRRVTDKRTLDLVTMVYGGLINKNIVASLQAKGCSALGLTGADGGIIKAVKRPVQEVDYGFVGDIQPDSVDLELLKRLLDSGLSTIFAPLTYSSDGILLNTNADTIANILATSMAKLRPVQLIYCFEKDGVLDANSEVIPKITQADLEHLQTEGIVKDGMIPKLTNACEAVKAGVKRVVIGNAQNLESIIEGKSGTEIV